MTVWTSSLKCERALKLNILKYPERKKNKQREVRSVKNAAGLVHGARKKWENEMEQAWCKNVF